MENTTFFESVDFDKLQEMQKKTESNVEQFEKIIRKTIEMYTSNLDHDMKYIYDNIVVTDQPSLDTLEECMFILSNSIYYMSEKLEELGIYDSISKQAYKEVYNNKYMDYSNPVDSKKKPTVAEITAMSENETLYESVTNDLYSRAYKIVKNKLDAANTMLSCISKIISRRMAEMQLTSTTPSGKQILNENMYSTDPNSTSSNSISENWKQF